MAELDDEWEFVKHVEGSANHKPQGYSATWTKYWKERIGRELPTLCPGVTNDGAHPLQVEKKGKGKKEKDSYGYVGAHVLIRHKQSGREKYVIIPTCSPCNRSQNPLHLFCRAVTIFDSDAQYKFVGKITLPDDYAARDKYNIGKKLTWWVSIHSVNVDDQNITIVGYSNDSVDGGGTPCGECTFNENHVCGKNIKCKLRRAIYPNVEDFLAELALLWRRVTKGFNTDSRGGRNMGVQKALLEYEQGFIPEIIRCGVGMGQEVHKKAYGLCKTRGCNRDRGVDGAFCAHCDANDAVEEIVAEEKAEVEDAPANDITPLTQSFTGLNV